MKIGRLSRRAISLLAGAMLLVSVLAGVLCMGAAAEEGDYMANAESWMWMPLSVTIPAVTSAHGMQRRLISPALDVQRL